MSAAPALVPIPNPQFVGSVTDLLALHGSWNQSISVTMPGRGGVTVPLTSHCVWPVTLYEYEVLACVHDATEESGLKWWLRRGSRTSGVIRDYQFNWGSLTFKCPHHRVRYVKQSIDNSRDSRHRSCLSCKCILSIKGTVVCRSLL